MRICLFEDKGYKNLIPLCHMRPVWDLICGQGTLKENIEKFFKTKINYFYSVRANENLAGEFLFINGRLLPGPGLLDSLKGRDRIFVSNNQLVAFRGTAPELKKILEKMLDEPSKEIEADIIRYPWDLLSSFRKRLERTKISKDAQLAKQAVLDDSAGPIYIGAGTVVHPFTILRGPLYIGEHCRIAGEVSSSIIMSYTNKAHYGFLGDSYVCSFVNLGAGTTNSNLKNNYGAVKVFINGKMIDSGRTFVGCFIGDHVKTAVGTMIYTGTVIGVGANIFGVPFVKKFVPPFAWGEKGRVEIDKIIETERIVMKRRNIELSDNYAKLMRKVYEEKD